MIINGETYYSRSSSCTANTQKRNAYNSAEQIKTQKQLSDEYKEKMKELLDPTNGMSDEEKASYENKINQKIKNGEKLSATEMQYLQIKSPFIYAMISRVQFQRKALEDKLKCCRSKEEVEKAYNDSILHINKNDPAKEPLRAAYDNVTQEFKKSTEYKALPQKTEGKNKNDKMPVIENNIEAELEVGSKYFQTEIVRSIIDVTA